MRSVICQTTIAMKKDTSNRISRRKFIESSARIATVGSMALGFPAIVPSTVFGKKAPSNRINIGAIGTGRISQSHDLPGVWKFDQATVVAVCDLDKKRANDAKVLINQYYTQKKGKPYDGVTVYNDYHQLLQNKDIDAVIISTPDHWN